MDKTTILALLSALSLASERVVEIVKGLWPWLNKETPNDEKNEGKRKAFILSIAAVAGILLAWLAQEIPGVVKGDGTNRDWLTTIALGLLSVGGSGFWNSIQTSLNKLKDATKKLAS